MSEELITATEQAAPVTIEPLRTGKPHISFSELKDWVDCSFRHKLKHIDRLDVFRPSYHLAFGTAVHAALEDFLETRVMKPEIAFTQLEKLWRPEYANAEPKEKDFSIDKLKQQIVDILTEVPAWLEEQFPGWELVAAEQALYETINNHRGKFKGFVDCIIKVKDKKGKEQIWIIDWKTSGGGWSPMKKKDPMTGLQLTLYKGFWIQKLQDPAYSLKNVRCAFVILKRKAKPGKHCDRMDVSVGEVTLQRGLKLVTNMLMSLDRGIAIKNRNNCTWCDFKGTEHCP